LTEVLQPKFTDEQIDYMVNRSINLLLSNLENPHGAPWLNYAVPSLHDKIRTVFSVMFLRQFMYLNGDLFNRIVPGILRRLASVTTKVENRYDWYVRGRVNWQKTILTQIASEDSFVTTEPIRQYLTPENIMLSLTLQEVGLHARDLENYFSPLGFVSELDFLEEIRELSRMVGNHIYLKSCAERAGHYLRAEETFLSDRLQRGSTSTHGARYQTFSSYVEDSILSKRIVNRAYLQLLEWRKIYADLVNGFASIQGKEFLQTEWSEDRIFEIWVLCELLAYMKREGVNVEPHSALFEGRGKPLYYVGASPVYYNTSLEIEESEETIPQLSRQYVRGSRPDVIILNVHDPSSSIILDMKNYSETSSAAHLKILGYMKNYAVNHGGVVYPISIESRFLNVVEEVPGFIRSMPHGEGNFIAATITPGEQSETKNEAILARLTNFIRDNVLEHSNELSSASPLVGVRFSL
jgi:hypothetical protein